MTPMSEQRLAVYLVIVAALTAVLFVAHAVSGADLCVWCPVLGR